MSVSPLPSVSSSTPSSIQPNLEQSTFLQVFQRLARALGAGNLQGAQQAYATLQQLQGSGPNQNDPNNPLSQALNQIGQYLQSGDLTDALKTLVSLLQQIQGGQGHRNSFAGDGGNSNNAPLDASGNIGANQSNASGNTGTNQSGENLSLTVTDSIQISISGNGTNANSTQSSGGQSSGTPSLTVSETVGLKIDLTV
jgi:hypothetical protein